MTCQDTMEWFTPGAIVSGLLLLLLLDRTEADDIRMRVDSG